MNVTIFSVQKKHSDQRFPMVLLGTFEDNKDFQQAVKEALEFPEVFDLRQ